MKRSYKYRINELLTSLPLREYKKALRVIPAKLGVSAATFNNYRSIQVGESQDIPHEKVMMLEQLFRVGRGELENFTTDLPPISDIPDKDDPGEAVLEKFNLSK